MWMGAELAQLLRPHYWLNILLSVSYLVAKRTPGVCSSIFADASCELDGRETEILFFLLVVVALRTRKAGSLTMLHYLSSAFLYAKIANAILWCLADARFGLAFGAAVILVGLMFPEPTYQGPENIVYFRGLQNLQEELSADQSVTWLVCFFAAWHPACVHFAPVFSQLSDGYSGGKLRFGKIDIGRYPEAAAKYHIVDGPTSRQLPSLLLLAGGREVARRPHADSKGKLVKFVFTVDNVKSHFELDRLRSEGRARAAESAKDK